MRPKLLLLLPVLLAPFFGQGQGHEFGKVTAEERALKTCPLDTGAAAVVLFEIGQISIDEENKTGYLARYTRHRRIKILRREGFEYGTVAIPYYSASGDEFVSNAKAVIHLPDGTSKSIEKGQFFKEKHNKNYTALKFTFPDLQPGAIIEYSYEKSSTYIQTLDPWYFQDEIPTLFSQLEFVYTDHFSYIALQNAANLRSEKKRDRLVYTTTDMPALHAEPFVTTMDDFRAMVRFQLKEYVYSDGATIKVLESWGAVAEALHRDENFGKFLRSDDDGDVMAAAAAAIEGAADTLERVKILAHFVANAIQFNGSERFHATDDSSPDKLFRKKSGSNADINLLLVHLINRLKVAKAMPMLISSRENGQPYLEYPFTHQFNYVLGYTVVGGQPIVLDAVDPLRPFNLANKDAYNQNGLVVDKKTAFWAPLQPPNDGHLCDLKAVLLPDGTLKGHLDWTFFAYSAVTERAKRNEKAGLESWKKRLAGQFPSLSISNFSTVNFADAELPLRVSFDFEMPVEQSGDLFYIQPVLFTEFMQNPFKPELRENPVSFATKYRMTISANIALPEGFRLEDKPEDINLVLPDKGGNIRFFSKQEGQDIAVQIRFLLNQTSFSTGQYPVLRTFFDLWAQKVGNVLVVKKG